MKRNVNLDVKFEAAKNSVQLYEIARQLGIAESTFYRHLRYELPDEERQKMLDSIKQITIQR